MGMRARNTIVYVDASSSFEMKLCVERVGRNVKRDDRQYPQKLLRLGREVEVPGRRDDVP